MTTYRRSERGRVIAAAGWIVSLLLMPTLVATAASPESIQPPLPGGASRESIARQMAELIAAAIPRSYSRRQNWGHTKQIATGLRVTWRERRLDVRRRKKDVPHGVWTHYRIDLDAPDDLALEVTDLRGLSPGHIGFRLHGRAKLDSWIRVKSYHYGVHLGAYEVLGMADIGFDVELDVGMGLAAKTAAAIELDPKVVDAKLSIHEVKLQRISNARGPLVRELGKGLRGTIEAALNDKELTEKLNRAIDRKRDALTLSASQFLP